jgi:hypothetical protein
MWQKCPLCEGEGFLRSNIESIPFFKCSVCNGRKIISEITGLPPSLPQTEIKINNEDKPE